MPYAPGVQDQRAEIITRSGENFRQSLMDGFRQYQQNKTMAGQATARVEGAISADPELAKILSDPNAANVPKEAFKAYAKLQKDGTLNVRDASFLAQYTDSFSKEKQEQARRAAQQAQIDQYKAVTAEANAATEARKQQMAREAQQRTQLNQIGSGVGRGVYSPQVLNNPVTQQAAQIQQAFPAQNLGADDMSRFMQAKAAQDQANRLSKSIDPYGIRTTGPKGEPIEKTVDRFTGNVLGSGPVSQPPRAYPTAQEAGETELAKTVANESAKSSQKLVDEISSNAEAAQATLPRLAAIEKLYDAGEKTGWGQDTLNQVTAAATRLGLYSGDKQATKEELQLLLATDAVTKAREFLQGQGAVSNEERKRIDKIAADVGKTPAANMMVIRMVKAVQERAVEMEAERRRLVDAEKTTPQVAEGLRRWRMAHPLEFGDAATGKSIDDILKKYEP